MLFNTSPSYLESFTAISECLKALDKRERAVTRAEESKAGNLIKWTGVSAAIGCEDLWVTHTYGDEDRGCRWLTAIGKHYYRYLGESDHAGGYSGPSDLIVGGPCYAYHYQRLLVVDVNKALDHALGLLLEGAGRIKLEVEEMEAKAAAEKRAYGKAINAKFKELGADSPVINAWWKMPWKDEMSLQDYMAGIYRALADRQAFALAQVARSGADLEELGWKCRPSTPRSEAFIKAVAEATGIEPATPDEYKDWKWKPRRWVFDE
jgi:hypothetical protein